MNQLQASRNSRVLDSKSEKQSNSRILSYLNQHKIQLPKLKIRQKTDIQRKRLETHIRRYSQKQQITILSIRFASSQASDRKIQEQLYIKHTQRELLKDKEQQKQAQRNLPYIRYRKQQSPVQHLRNLGYNPDIRLSSEIYSDKVQQKKLKYLNKMQLLKRDLNSYTSKQNNLIKSRIHLKILGQEIRRKRQRENILNEQRKGRRMLSCLLNSSNKVTSV